MRWAGEPAGPGLYVLYRGAGWADETTMHGCHLVRVSEGQRGFRVQLRGDTPQYPEKYKDNKAWRWLGPIPECN